MSLLTSVKFSQLLEQLSFIELAFIPLAFFLSFSLSLSFGSFLIFTINIHKIHKATRLRTPERFIPPCICTAPPVIILLFTVLYTNCLLKYISFYVHIQVLLVIKFEHLSLAKRISRIVGSSFTRFCETFITVHVLIRNLTIRNDARGATAKEYLKCTAYNLPLGETSGLREAAFIQL